MPWPMIVLFGLMALCALLWLYAVATMMVEWRKAAENLFNRMRTANETMRIASSSEEVMRAGHRFFFGVSAVMIWMGLIAAIGPLLAESLEGAAAAFSEGLDAA